MHLGPGKISKFDGWEMITLNLVMKNFLLKKCITFLQHKQLLFWFSYFVRKADYLFLCVIYTFIKNLFQLLVAIWLPLLWLLNFRNEQRRKLYSLQWLWDGLVCKIYEEIFTLKYVYRVDMIIISISKLTMVVANINTSKWFYTFQSFML